MSRGKYIVIEGNDGTGKSTQVELLAAWLKEEKEIDSFVMHEPGGVPIADAIRDVIKNGELERDAETNLLLFTASRHELWKQAKKELDSGKWVLSARNYFSTLIYQGYAEGLSTQTIEAVTLGFTDHTYMNPDKAIVLTVSDHERNQRIAKRGTIERQDTFESRGADFQDKLRAGYEQLILEKNIAQIDASAPIMDVQLAIRNLVTTECKI